MKPTNSQTSNFLRLIGSPYIDNEESFEDLDSKEFYTYATKNRIRLLYLDNLAKRGKLKVLKNEYIKLLEKYNRIQESFTRISKLLERSDINYAFFKSIRPYHEVTSDIDVLIFGSHYVEILQLLSDNGYRHLGTGPLSTTFRDIKSEVNLDIYNDVGVSHLIYIDKNKLSKYVFGFYMSGSYTGQLLRPEADLLTVIAHSVIKEQLYVLSEYYTTLHYLKNFKVESLSSFVSLVERCRLRSAVKTHLSITAFLHYSAHGFVPEPVSKLLTKLHSNSNFDLVTISKNGPAMPHRFHPLTIINAFFELVKEPKTRRSYADQILYMLNPALGTQFLKLAMNHLIRETY